MSATLLLIRHGQASFGARNYDALSDTGREQARIVGAHLARLGRTPDRLLSGRMQRQRDTAAELTAGAKASALNVEAPLSAFDEFDAEALFKAYLPGVLAADPELAKRQSDLFTDRRVFQRAFEGVLAPWIAARQPQAPLTETWRTFCDRVVAGLGQIAALADDGPNHQTLAVVTSGGPISVAIRHALSLDDTATFAINWRIYNASITELRLRPAPDQTGAPTATLLGFNDVSGLRLAGDALLTHR